MITQPNNQSMDYIGAQRHTLHLHCSLQRRFLSPSTI